MADLFAKYNCTYCQEDITGLRIKCATCTDFDLCLQCFSAGAEIGTHKNAHPYQFMDSGSIGVCLGRGGWSAREELHLLDAIEQYGFGNWEDISRHIETRTPEEAKEEYVARFIEGSVGRLTWPPTDSSRLRPVDHTSTDCGPLSPDVTSRLPPPDASRDDATALGYMPQRDDFEREFDNGSEALVSPLYVNVVEDDDLDINLKLAQVDQFTWRLRRRASRKRVARDYQLISQFFLAARKDRAVVSQAVTLKRKITKDQKELTDKMRPFTRFHTAQEHDQFVQGLLVGQDLQFRLRELYRYRHNGITNKEECVHFEQDRLQQDHWKERKSGSSSSGCNVSSPATDQKRGLERSEVSSSLGERLFLRSQRYLNSSQDDTGAGAEEDDQSNPSDLSSYPNYHLLSPHEIQVTPAFAQSSKWKPCSVS